MFDIWINGLKLDTSIFMFEPRFNKVLNNEEFFEAKLIDNLTGKSLGIDKVLYIENADSLLKVRVSINDIEQDIYLGPNNSLELWTENVYYLK